MTQSGPEGRFTQGSIMRHVVVMTSTASLGLMFMFLIDAATLFWVSQLGEERLVAALGYAWTVQFFTISVGIALSIATTALVSRSLGARDRETARVQATTALVISFVLQSLVALLVVIFCPTIFALIGAKGETAAEAVRFLRISVPALPMMVIGMVGSAILRAQGDAWRAMTITLIAGMMAMVLDPLFIFGFGLGIDGAAIVVSLSRIASSLLALYYIIWVHDLAAKVSFRDVRLHWSPFWIIALPSFATAMAGPVGNAILTTVISEFGDSAVAGWSVVSRLTVLAFGGIFALSGALGGIFGQNYGAGLMSRVKHTFRDGILFSTAYVLIVWLLLVLANDQVIAAFGLEGEAARVLTAFSYVAAGCFVFNAMTFVANAGFNNLGKPIYSAYFTWTRDAVLTLPLALWLSAQFMAPGVIYAQALAGLLTGVLALVIGWNFVNRVASRSHEPVAS